MVAKGKIKPRHEMLAADRKRAIRFFWQSGFNTFEISKRTDMSEAQVYNLMASWNPTSKEVTQ